MLTGNTYNLKQTKRIIIKLGTGLLTSRIGQVNPKRIQMIASQITLLHNLGIEVVVVSSGAIGLGMGRLNLKERPKDLATLQACAAIGQTILMENWRKAFDAYHISVAQLLLTRRDIQLDKEHQLPIKNTIEKLISLKIIPIVNENDSVSTEEITFSDNDILSAMVAEFTQAQLLIIFSTVSGLIDLEGTGKLIPVVEEITSAIEDMAGGTKSVTSVGGMRSKIEAAKIAVRSGCGVLISDGTSADGIQQLIEGKLNGTFFVPKG